MKHLTSSSIALLASLIPVTATAQIGRSYSASHFALKLDGAQVGLLQSSTGGGVYADVVEELTSNDYFSRKHLGRPKYQDISVTSGFGLGHPFWEWIESTLEMKHTRKSGSIVAADFNFAARTEREFFHALITEIGIPACDGSSKDPAYIGVKFQPEYTKYKKADGKFESTINDKQKTWLPSNFRLELGDLDTKHVSRIAAITIKQSISRDAVGDSRDYQIEPGKIEFPDLKITIPNSALQSWVNWEEDFIVKGNNGDKQEKSGALVFLATNRTDELARLLLLNCGIFNLVDAMSDDGKPHVGFSTASIYCERMELHVGK